MKRIVLLVVLAFIFVRCSKKTEGREVEKRIAYSFFVAGHVYGEPGVNNVGVHPPFKSRFGVIQNDKNIELGVFTGDIVYEPSAQDWDEIDQDVKTLGIPVYFAPGNHDMLDRPMFERRYGQTYFDFIHNDDLFIILDPNIDQWNISGDQLQFLKTALAQKAAQVNNVFVFFHQVLWWSQDNK